MAELGAGGGQGDLNQRHELETSDESAVSQLIAFCATKLQDQPQLQASVLEMLSAIRRDHTRSIVLNGSAFQSDGHSEDGLDISNIDELPLERLVPVLVRFVTMAKEQRAQAGGLVANQPSTLSSARVDGLPKQIVSTRTLLLAG